MTDSCKPCVLALLCWLGPALGGCTPLVKDHVAPVAVAGEDLMLSGASVDVTLDGSRSYDPDGEIVGYEWRYTGWPAGFMPAAPPAIPADDDGGTPPPPPELPVNPALDPVAANPPFCSTDETLYDDKEHTAPASVQIRYCLIGHAPKTTVKLTPGGFRFTLYVEDDDGEISGDTLDVLVEP